MKRKLLLTLSIFLVILFGTGASAMWLLSRTSERYSDANISYFREIQHLHSLRYETSRINNFYLPPMLQSEKPPPEFFETTLLENSIERMAAALNDVATTGQSSKRKEFALLQEAFASYQNRLQRLFVEPTPEREERADIVSSVSEASQRITQKTESLIAGLEISMSETHTDLRSSTLQSNWLLGSLLLFGLIASALVYVQTSNSLVDPIVGLTQSVKQIQQGNFELNLPLRRNNDELAQLIPAFNKMAAELRSMRRATKDQFLKVDIQNRAIMASFPNPIILLDEVGQIEKMNVRAQQLLDDLGILSGLPSNVESKVQAAIEKQEELLPERLDEALLLRVHETEQFYLPRIFKFSTLEADSKGWVLLLSDVTRLRFFDDLKTNLISTVSHEIKTPLTGIRMVLHLLLEKKTGNLTNTQEEMLNSALGDCERLLKTLRNLLEMSRLDSGSSSLQLEDIDSNELLEEAIQLFKGMAADHQVTFERAFADNLPLASGDRIRLGEVVNNFLSNAIKHSPRGGKITLQTSRQSANHIRVCVMDEGEGVPEESKGRIFERFYRAPNQQQIDGIGLGLSIAREIITAHEGRIGLAQGDQGQTKFYFDLPVS